MDTIFTERQLRIIREALIIGGRKLEAFGRWWEIEALKSDVDDLLQFERDRKKQRKISLATERRSAKAPHA